MKNLKALLMFLSFPLITSITPYRNNFEDKHTIEDLLKSEAFVNACNEVKKIKFLPDEIRYGKDYIQTSAETDSLCTGDCDDKSSYLARNLKKAGYDVEICIGIRDTTKSDTVNHMWIEYRNHVIEPNIYSINKKGIKIPKVRVFDKCSLDKGLYKSVNASKDYQKKFRKAQKSEDVFLRLR